MSTALTTTSDNAMVLAGHVANEYAKAGVFENYAERQSDNTLRRRRSDLAVFAQFLCSAGIFPCPPFNATDEEKRAFFVEQAKILQATPGAWHGVTWGLVEGYRNWMAKAGYAIGSINVRLSTVKTYAKLANKADVLTVNEYAMIKAVEGYSRKDARKVDEKRDVTRTGSKKASNVVLTKTQADALKDQPDTPQGRRDAVIMALLLDHGLRVGELAALEVSAFDLGEKKFTFYRAKVDKTQTHNLTRDSYAALSAWLKSEDAPALGPLLRGSRKGGHLTDVGMKERSITERVRVLGEDIGISGLSAHDCRHYWATFWAKKADQGKISLFRLQEAGGWSSLQMPRRYVEDAAIANEGMD